MKRILACTTALALSASPLLAESHMNATQSGTDTAATTSGDSMESMNYADLIRTRDITGGAIYTTNPADDEWSMDTQYSEVDPGWNEIGEIEDIVLDKSGQMIGIVAEVGGFLDIADKHVLVQLDRVRLVPVDDRSYAIVTNLSEEELESPESVAEGWCN